MKISKIIAGIMAVCIMGMACPSLSNIFNFTEMTVSAEIINSGTCGKSLKYTIDDSGTLTISGKGDMEDCSYDIKPWNAIKSIKQVIIENGVTSIGNYAFSGCYNLTSIEIPDTVTHIGEKAFYDCNGLTSLKIPCGVQTIGICAFQFCEGLTSLEISDGVTVIEDFAFYYCTSLTSVEIPNSIKEIGINAFYECDNLEKVKILNSECKIADFKNTITNNGIGDFNGAIYGYDNSTAQVYAEKYGRNFVSLGQAPEKEMSAGDINCDGFIDSVDATAVLVEYAQLSTTGNSTLSAEQKKVADINGDGLIDSVDATNIMQYYAYLSIGGADDIEMFMSSLENKKE